MQPKPQKKASSGGRVPSLDVLRSLAITLVFFDHAGVLSGRPALHPLIAGGAGVDLFFVLSGWLLGRQLLVELRARDTIDVPRFLARRWMRTLPAYYALLAANLAQAAWQAHEVQWH